MSALLFYFSKIEKMVVYIGFAQFESQINQTKLKCEQPNSIGFLKL